MAENEIAEVETKETEETTEEVKPTVGQRIDAGIDFVKAHWKAFAGGAVALVGGGLALALTTKDSDYALEAADADFVDLSDGSTIETPADDVTPTE